MTEYYYDDVLFVFNRASKSRNHS